MSETNLNVFTWLGVATIFVATSFCSSQDFLAPDAPIGLSDALLRLQMIETAPTSTLPKQPRPVEFLDEFPQSRILSLDSCRKAAEYSAKMDGRAMVVIIDNKPGYERYEPGWSRWKSHPLGNASQCFAGLAAALAVQDGMLKFDDPVSATITEWADDLEKSKVTIRQLLTLTSGIAPGEVSVASTYKTAINAKLESNPGEAFGYGSHSFQIFGELICRKLQEKSGVYDPMGYVTYLDRKLFKPMKVEIGPWSQTLDKEANIASGAWLSAVDFAKFGALLANQGQWEGETLIKPELLLEILKGTEANPKYGMGVWLVSQQKDIDVSPDARMIMPSFGRTNVEGMCIAAGEGKQRLYVLPKEKIVIVRLGNPRTTPFRDEAFFRNALVEQDNP
jgi:CubicO group peptidase (beta-lactamase class C family)